MLIKLVSAGILAMMTTSVYAGDTKFYASRHGNWNVNGFSIDGSNYCTAAIEWSDRSSAIFLASQDDKNMSLILENTEWHLDTSIGKTVDVDVRFMLGEQVVDSMDGVAIVGDKTTVLIPNLTDSFVKNWMTQKTVRFALETTWIPMLFDLDESGSAVAGVAECTKHFPPKI